MMPRFSLLLTLIVFVGCSGPDIHDVADVQFGEQALSAIQSDARNWVPEGAADFYSFHVGFAGNHTNYWSFQCATLSDCYVVAEHYFSANDLLPFAMPKRRILAKGPAYFDDSFRTANWDLTKVPSGVMAERFVRDDRLDFLAIDTRHRRIYFAQWSGGFPDD